MGTTVEDLVRDLSSKPRSYERDKLINMARRGDFHCFKSERFDTPKVELVKRLFAVGYKDLAAKAMDGAYDEKSDAVDKAELDALLGGGGRDPS